MKKTVMLLACALAITSGAVEAEATTLTYGDARYLGAVVPGIPPSDAAQVSYVTALISLAPGAQTNCDVNPEPDLCTRANSTVGGSFPSPVSFGFKNETGSSTINSGVNGFQYVLAKYGGGVKDGVSYVWYVAGGISDGVVIVPSSSQATHGSLGLSHVTFFNKAVSVPDGGSTLALLGAALMGLGALRRKLTL